MCTKVPMHVCACICVYMGVLCTRALSYMCIYVCMSVLCAHTLHMCVCACMHLCTSILCICSLSCVYIYVHGCAVCKFMYMHSTPCLYACMFVPYACLHMCTHMPVHNMCAHVCMHTCAYSHMYTHIPVHACAYVCYVHVHVCVHTTALCTLHSWRVGLSLHLTPCPRGVPIPVFVKKCPQELAQQPEAALLSLGIHSQKGRGLSREQGKGGWGTT